MEKIQFDSGVQSYILNGGEVLRFNPADPNIYARFSEAAEKITDLEKTLVADAQALSGEETGKGVLTLFARADEEMKKLLSWVFGTGNDFHKLLQGVNLLAVADNGQRVITNFLEAVQPILLAGAERCIREKEKEAVEKANRRRKSQ